MHYLDFQTPQRYIRAFVIILFLFCNLISFSQTPTTQPAVPGIGQPNSSAPIPIDAGASKQATDFYNRAKSAGMSDADIQRAARQRGYSGDQINSMLQRLENGPGKTPANDARRDEIDDSRSQIDEDDLDDEANNKRDSTLVGRSALGRRSRVFGASFFRSFSNTFEPNLRLATPTNYILGPEDELIVDIYGNSVDNFKLKISPEGTVKMLNLAPVQVNGLTIEQARGRILNRLREAYMGLDRPGSGTHMTITLGDVRSIRIMITGEVVRPGTYTVSSLATAFNALYQSGGPTINGSFRNIEIIRNNVVVRKIDLYRFLIDADLKDNIALRDQDIILIRPYEKRVELTGEVRRRGIYEPIDKETVQDLIKYAGGYTPEALTTSISYQRNTGTSYIIGTVQKDALPAFLPENGDIFSVTRILDAVTNQIEIRGAVIRPGVFALEDGCNTVLQLIEKAQGLSPRAFANRATLERSSGDSQTGILAIDLEKLVNKQIGDIPLLPGDILTIKSIEDLKEFTYINISGSVINPGAYYYYKDITIADLIFQAGGYMEEGVPYRIEVSRRVKNDTLNLPASQNVRIFTLNIEDNLRLNQEDQKFKLNPYDIISVRKSPRYEVQKMVTILGEVTYPGSYTILTNFERISDIFPKAGGLKKEAYLEGARFYRGGELVAVNLSTVIDKPSLPANLLLRNHDTLYIPTKPQIVRIQGGVQNPSLINFEPGFSFKDYVSQAGGFAERAWKNRIYVSNLNGRTFRTKRFLLFRSYPPVEAGSTITIPVKTPKPDRQTSPAERIAIFSLLATLSITIIRLFNN